MTSNNEPPVELLPQSALDVPKLSQTASFPASLEAAPFVSELTSPNLLVLSFSLFYLFEIYL
jgi:hypothetical protein